jgi:cell division protein ZapA (FtsZ GTPase activity inhibitor)
MSGANDRRAVAVRIAGHDYKLRSDGDDEGLVRIAGYVDQAMDRVRERTGTVDSLDVAVLTCLNLARELLALHEQRARGGDDERVRELIKRVEAAVVTQPRPDSAKVPLEVEARVDSSTDSKSRTLEISSVEEMRDRLQAGTGAGDEARMELTRQARVASGGRDRIG